MAINHSYGSSNTSFVDDHETEDPGSPVDAPATRPGSAAPAGPDDCVTTDPPAHGTATSTDATPPPPRGHHPLFRTGVTQERVLAQRDQARQAQAQTPPMDMRGGHQRLVRTPAVGGSAGASATPPGNTRRLLTRQLGMPLGQADRVGLAVLARPTPVDTQALLADFNQGRPVALSDTLPTRHAPASAQSSTASVASTTSHTSVTSTVSNSSVDSNLAFSVYDPDEPAASHDDFDAGPRPTPEEARQRNIDHMPPRIASTFDRLSPLKNYDSSDAAHTRLTADLNALFTLPLNALSNEQVMRTYGVFRADVTARGDQLFEALQSASTADTVMRQLRETPSAQRAQALAAIAWAAAADPFITREDDVSKRLQTLCQENRALAGPVDACIQRLECRSEGHRLLPGLHTTPSRKAEAFRLSPVWEDMLQTLGIRDFRSGEALTGASPRSA